MKEHIHVARHSRAHAGGSIPPVSNPVALATCYAVRTMRSRLILAVTVYRNVDFTLRSQTLSTVGPGMAAVSSHIWPTWVEYSIISIYIT